MKQISLLKSEPEHDKEEKKWKARHMKLILGAGKLFKKDFSFGTVTISFVKGELICKKMTQL